MLAETDELRGDDPALVAFDAPLGLPRSYLAAARAASFVEWLARVDDVTLSPLPSGEAWTVARPFVRPRLRGSSWRAAEAAAAAAGVDLLRGVDRASGAQSVFRLVGAKQVGAAATALWRDLREARERGREFSIWPFEAAAGVTVAEIYPALALRELPRPPRSKRDAAARREALASLAEAGWARLLEPEEAAATDDDFDAAVTAAALLRRLRQRRPLAPPDAVDPLAEGAILLS